MLSHFIGKLVFLEWLDSGREALKVQVIFFHSFAHHIASSLLIYLLPKLKTGLGVNTLKQSEPNSNGHQQQKNHTCEQQHDYTGTWRTVSSEGRAVNQFLDGIWATGICFSDSYTCVISVCMGWNFLTQFCAPSAHWLYSWCFPWATLLLGLWLIAHVYVLQIDTSHVTLVWPTILRVYTIVSLNPNSRPKFTNSANTLLVNCSIKTS